MTYSLLTAALAKPTKVKVEAGFDGGPGDGGYAPQMSEKDAKRWKAKVFNLGKENARIELRKSYDTAQLTVFVAVDGWDYATKNEKRAPNLKNGQHHKDTRGLNVRISMNGPLLLTFEQYDEINRIIVESSGYLYQHKIKADIEKISK